MIRYLCLLVLSVSVVGCGSSSTPTSPSAANVPYSQTDLVVGTGAEATAGRSLTVNYTGWFYDSTRADNKGTQFDSSVGRGPYAFTLGAGAVIRGWDQGVVGMRVGGTRRLVLPPDLAYGARGNNSIPPNATLVFDIQLLTVQ